MNYNLQCYHLRVVGVYQADSPMIEVFHQQHELITFSVVGVAHPTAIAFAQVFRKRISLIRSTLNEPDIPISLSYTHFPFFPDVPYLSRQNCYRTGW